MRVFFGVLCCCNVFSSEGVSIICLPCSQEIVPVNVARRLQGIFFLPFFMTMCVTMFATFATLTLVAGLPMNSEQVFVTFGLFLALRIPLTIFIPFSVQYISEMNVVSSRVQVSSCFFFFVVNAEFYGKIKAQVFLDSGWRYFPTNHS